MHCNILIIPIMLITLSILHSVLPIIAGKPSMSIMVIDHADASMLILHSAPFIIGCELSIVATLIMLMIPYTFFILLSQSQDVSCTFGDCDHADNFMSILHSTLVIIGCKLCLVEYW